MKKHNENFDVYVQLDSSSAHDAKRDILEMTESVINMQLISEKLKKLQKEELAERNISRKQIKTMVSEINQIVAKMPQVVIEKSKIDGINVGPMKVREANEPAAYGKVERKTLNQELEDIKRKIESLKK